MIDENAWRTASLGIFVCGAAFGVILWEILREIL